MSKMKRPVSPISYTGALESIATHFRAQWPVAILSLGGVLTLLWVALIAWIPLRLIASAISMAINGMLTI
jgi:hypothetical protein